MAETTAAPVMPPVERLLALKPVTLPVRIVLEMIGGATWTLTDPGDWWLERPTGKATYRALLALSKESGVAVMPDLADPFTDSAAAWELETRELGDWSTSPSLGHAYMWSAPGGNGWDEWKEGPWHADRKHAAVLAVLHKHADGPLSPLIRSLLERMENTP